MPPHCSDCTHDAQIQPSVLSISLCSSLSLSLSNLNSDPITAVSKIVNVSLISLETK
jgi:hypothetical protein